MIRSSRPLSHPPKFPPALDPSASPRRPTAYGAPFWLAYVANTVVMVAIALLFRYADFVTLLGGDEFHLGWIVGVGMVGSLAMRLALGLGIDHYGPRAVWLGSIVLFALTCFAHLAVTSCYGPMIYLLRIVLCCAAAGIFGASMTFISGRVSAARMAEMIGMLGTSGFLGMVLGTQLGDLLLGTEMIQRQQIEWMFFAAGLLGSCSAVFVFLATRGHARPVHPKRPPLVQLLRRYHPGMVLLVGIAMGIGLGMPGTFLRPYVAELGVPRIGLFFGVYAPTAIVTRILTRRLPERVGTTPMILAGIGGLMLSQLLFLLVGAEWQLVLPGAGYGVSHAILLPSLVAAGTRAFPRQHHGLGTTLILATWDVGQLVGAPAAGAILHYSEPLGLPAYPTMFVSIAILLATIGIGYACTSLRGKSFDPVALRPHEDRVGDRSGEPASIGDFPPAVVTED